MMKKKLIFILAGGLFAIGGFFYFRNQVYYSHGENSSPKMFLIEKGESVSDIAVRLKQEGFISGKIYFYYYLKVNNLWEKIYPGEYQIFQSMTIGEIARIITNPQEKFIRVTFPEGFDSRQMTKRLNENGLPGDNFLKIVENPQDLKKRYSYLSEEKVLNLEGYLFPDTYFFKSDISAENIVGRMLDNFDAKFNQGLRDEIKIQKRSIREIVTMASILEMEVKTKKDRELVSGIFWKRIEENMPLQSDITLTYATGEKKEKYSLSDIETNSPYNTYKFAGLPPGPINNPGKESIESAIYPKESEYLYFLSDPRSGQTIFSKTYPEHLIKKEEVGL